MNELIKITEQNGKKAVSARDLHEFLEVKSRFNDWIANRIEKYDLVENLDYITLTENLVSGGQRKEIVLSVDAAKELSMVEGNEKGKQARRYFTTSSIDSFGILSISLRYRFFSKRQFRLSHHPSEFQTVRERFVASVTLVASVG